MLARAITIAAFANKVTLGFTSDIKNLVPALGVFKPTLVVSVPRVFEKVYNTAEQNARNDGKGRIFEIAANTAIEFSQAQDGNGPGLVLKLKHALFDKLVYGKLRAALGGNCHAAISGGAPLGARLGHFYRGVGLTIYEGYGLTESSAAVTANQVGAVKVGSVGKLLPGNSMRLADDDELLPARRCRLRWLLAQRTGHRGRVHRRLVPHRRPRRDRRGRLPDDHRAQEGDHRHRGRQERRPGGARGPAARAPADQPGDGRRATHNRSSRH